MNTQNTLADEARVFVREMFGDTIFRSLWSYSREQFTSSIFSSCDIKEHNELSVLRSRSIWPSSGKERSETFLSVELAKV